MDVSRGRIFKSARAVWQELTVARVLPKMAWLRRETTYKLLRAKGSPTLHTVP